MSYPVPWINYLGYGLSFGRLPEPTWDMSFDGVDYPPDYLPDDGCYHGKPDCMHDNWIYEAGAQEAFTNYTFIPGQPTLPDDMYDWSQWDNPQEIKDAKHPWSSPGSAPVFGGGCGAAGGSPLGCFCHEEGPVNYCYGDDDRPYGYCCGTWNASEIYPVK